MANLSKTLHINFYQNRSSIVEVMIKNVGVFMPHSVVITTTTTTTTIIIIMTPRIGDRTHFLICTQFLNFLGIIFIFAEGKK